MQIIITGGGGFLGQKLARALLQGPHPFTELLLVDPAQRGTGVGRKLIEFVYATAKADGCCKVHWLTHETNATAIQLYERIAERPGFIQFRKGL